MASQTSQLVVRLRDEVSTPAGRASRSLRNLKNEARGSAGVNSMMSGAARAGLALGGASLGIYGVARGLKAAYTEAASFDRRMTRVGTTADASMAATKAATKQVQAIARDVALPVNQVVDGLDALVSQGRALSDAMSFLPSVAKTAQASGAEVSDIARTADSVGTNFKIAGKDMEGAFDIMVAGGKAGQFELKDMARYLPSLAPAAAAVGLRGAEGLSQMVAMLQIVRKGSGTAEEAGASMSNIFQKMETDETSKKFGKFGINLRKEMATARKSGRNLLEVFEELSDKALKGDLSKLPQLFSDSEFARGMRALLTYRGEWKKLQTDMRNNAAGSVDRDIARVTGDAQASIDNLDNAWGNFTRSFGRGLDGAGVSVALNSVSGQMESLVDSLEKGDTLLQRVQRRMLAFEKEKNDGKPPELKPLDKAGKWIYDNVVPNLPIVAGYNAIDRWAGTSGEDAEAQGRQSAQRDRVADEQQVFDRRDDLRNRVRSMNDSSVRVPIDTKDSLARELEAAERRVRAIEGNRFSRLRINMPGEADGTSRSAGSREFGLEVPSFGRFPSDVPLPPPRPSFNGDLDAAKGKAAEAGQALQSLDVTVAPNVDLASIRAARTEIQGLLSDLAKVGPATGRVATLSSNFGQQFESARNGSFADFEHG